VIDEAPASRQPASLRTRVSAGVRVQANWWQFARFGAVGASGYVVNLLVFWLAVHPGGLDHRAGATLAFLVAVSNNFVWNRHWTFDARDGHAGFQAARFFAVSIGAFLFSLIVLELLVRGGVPELAAQAAAILCATPVNFVGNRLWSFKLHR
jgi:putative flippase GtrA